MSLINGLNGNKKGHQIVTSIVDTIIHPQIQTEYTWTGKSGGKSTKKHAFAELEQVVSLVHATCLQTDPSYSSAECRKDLTYKVLKHSSSRWRDIQNKQNGKTNFMDDQSTIIISTMTDSSNERCQSNKDERVSNQNSDCVEKAVTNSKQDVASSSSENMAPNTLLPDNFDANKVISTLLWPIFATLQSDSKKNK